MPVKLSVKLIRNNLIMFFRAIKSTEFFFPVSLQLQMANKPKLVLTHPPRRARTRVVLVVPASRSSSWLCTRTRKVNFISHKLAPQRQWNYSNGTTWSVGIWVIINISSPNKSSQINIKNGWDTSRSHRF